VLHGEHDIPDFWSFNQIYTEVQGSNKLMMMIILVVIIFNLPSTQLFHALSPIQLYARTHSSI
jgi:hypothetical protein